MLKLCLILLWRVVSGFTPVYTAISCVLCKPGFTCRTALPVAGERGKITYNLCEDILADGTYNKDLTVHTMTHLADAGFTTFEAGGISCIDSHEEFETQEIDFAPNIVHTAEECIGSFCAGSLSHPQLSKLSSFTTTWSPDVDSFTRKCSDRSSTTKRELETEIGNMMGRMNSERLDLLQLDWNDLNNQFYFYATDHLMSMKEQGMVDQIGLFGFSAECMKSLIAEEAPVVTNQVSLSLVDTRPLRTLSTAAEEGNMKLLCYDTLLGGFLTSYWLGRQEPRFDYPSSLNGGTSGAGRYKERCLPRHLRTIQQWGGWSLFQELLAVLSIVADRHSGGVSVGTVAQRWVLDQRAVGAIVTSITERDATTERIDRSHAGDFAAESRRVLELQLDPEDHLAIAAVLGRSKSYCGKDYANSYLIGRNNIAT